MKKIMLLLEDYNEMIFLEMILKKVGFDCLGLQNEKSLADKMLGFSPHLVMADGSGRKINGLQLSQKINRPKGSPKIMLLLKPEEIISEQEISSYKIDGTLSRPYQPHQFIEVLSHILTLEAAPLISKLQKLGLSHETSQELHQIVRDKHIKLPANHGIPKETSLPMNRRLQGYEKHLAQLPDTTLNGIKKESVAEQVKEFRSRENDPEIQDIDKERFAFVRQLFKRNY